MRPALARVALLMGLLLAGQGLLVVTRILDHEAPLWLGFVTLASGLLILLAVASRSATSRAIVSPRRARLVLALGLLACGGTILYNLARGSTLGAPEVAILFYGLALVLASRRLERLGRAVAYSFPLVLAPLALYALNAALLAGVGATPFSWYLRYGLVAPMAGALALGGIDVAAFGDTVRLSTDRGALFLTVGIVCAGLYAACLFLGVFALFAWESGTRGWRLAAYLALGLAGLHVANLARLILLAVVGQRYGSDALQLFHQHAGWLLFLAWGVLYWWIVLRRLERSPIGSSSTRSKTKSAA